MLGIGRRMGRITYREIVGDTTQWKKEHIDDILDMCHLNKQQIVSGLASFHHVHRIEVLENLVWWVNRLQEGHLDMFQKFEWVSRAFASSRGPSGIGARTSRVFPC